MDFWKKNTFWNYYLAWIIFILFGVLGYYLSSYLALWSFLVFGISFLYIMIKFTGYLYLKNKGILNLVYYIVILLFTFLTFFLFIHLTGIFTLFIPSNIIQNLLLLDFLLCILFIILSFIFVSKDVYITINKNLYHQAPILKIIPEKNKKTAYYIIVCFACIFWIISMIYLIYFIPEYIPYLKK